METDLFDGMNQFIPQSEWKVKQNLDMNKELMEHETKCRNHEDIEGESQEGRFMMDDLVDLETGRDYHQTNEALSTSSLTGYLSSDKNLLNSVGLTSILDKFSDPQICENKDFISKAQENK